MMNEEYRRSQGDEGLLDTMVSLSLELPYKVEDMLAMDYFAFKSLSESVSRVFTERNRANAVAGRRNRGLLR